MEMPFKPASPASNPETRRFWEAAQAGQLLLKRCDSCNEAFFYPRELCPFCLSSSSWIEASGEGVVYSHTAVHAREGIYVVALVTLAEGPTMISNILVDDPGSVAIGQRVKVQFIETAGEERLPVFVPIEPLSADHVGRKRL